jgi:hypothetical protein
MPDIRLQGGEVVRLRRDHHEVKAGCCGIVWGVYNLMPQQYEATFVTESGELEDLVFEDQDCDIVLDIRETPFPDRILQIKQDARFVPGGEVEPCLSCLDA